MNIINAFNWQDYMYHMYINVCLCVLIYLKKKVIPGTQSLGLGND